MTSAMLDKASHFETTLASEPAWLFAERALYLPTHSALLIADAHLGKAAAFRKLGVPVPHGTTARNLAVISRLLEKTGAKQLIFLGDLFHNAVALNEAHSTVMQQWCQWRAQQSAGLEIMLIEGNHDAKALRAKALPAAMGITLIEGVHTLGAFALTHILPLEYSSLQALYMLSGHIHPSVYITGRAKQALRLPCFWFAENAGVLPAFGAFTGSYVVQPKANDRVFVIAGDEVMPLSAHK
jgi:uncharacterized protein